MDNQSSKPLNLPLAIFALLQIIFIILVSASLPNLFVSDEIPSYTFNAATMAHIQNLTEIFPELPSSDIEVLESNLFYVISSNSSNRSISQADVEANILADTIKTVYFERQNVNFFSATVDVPALEQSYQIFQEYSTDSSNQYIDNTRSSAILCPVGDAVLYPETSCTEIYTFFERPQIVASVIKLFSFSNFSLFMDDKEPTIISITPISSNVSESDKANYIKQTQSAVASLGISPDIFTYYVISSEDLTFIQDL